MGILGECKNVEYIHQQPKPKSHHFFTLVVQGGAGKHEVEAQPFGVDTFLALEHHGLADFQGLRGLSTFNQS